MSLKLMYITNNPKIAAIAENTGVDRIFVDLEKLGKQERQGNINSVKSNHSIDDIAEVKNALSTSELLVRVNPINPQSKEEINRVIENGADIVMLPMWKTVSEVKQFIDYVGGRAKVMLLLETKEADAIAGEVVRLKGIDEIHIGLNDLHLSYGKSFMFELLTDGTVERLCNIIRAAGIPYGFGGIAKLHEGLLPARNIIAEHYRLGSSMAILSRSFCDSLLQTDVQIIQEEFSVGMKEIRSYENELTWKNDVFFASNHNDVCCKVDMIVSKIKQKYAVG